ncbi:MAG: cytochrome c [Alphaproteobacteria bacterium]|nr:cytochrome c [Alphaproteobacteria bacterium]MBM3625630.1 cytochrome c [Alphaproteobacteria bacterium]
MRMALSLALGLIAAPAIAASADPTTGEKIVKAECASCHAIGRDAEAKSPDPKAPRFIDVAKMPSTTELSLKVFLRSSHKNMPNFILAPEEIDSLASYILALGGK